MVSEFSEMVLNNFRHPHYVGELSVAPNVYRVFVEIASGDKVQLDVAIHNAIITDVRYQVYGCPAMIACMSWLATELMNKPCALAEQITAQEISLTLALPARKFRCALLAETAMQEIMQQYRSTL
jgi:nitrogen fixation NifU-like protein